MERRQAQAMIHTYVEGQDVVRYDNAYKIAYNGTNYLAGYVCNETTLNLPESYNGEKYEIYKHAFRYCESITSINYRGNKNTKNSRQINMTGVPYYSERNVKTVISPAHALNCFSIITWHNQS